MTDAERTAEWKRQELAKLDSVGWPPNVKDALADACVALRKYRSDLDQPCHTSAYASGHALDDAMRRLLSLRSPSDYGLMQAFLEMIPEDERDEL